MLPLSSLLVAEFLGLISSGVITENVFGWQGTGTLFIRAVRGGDLNLLMGITLLFAIITILGNLLTDIVYSLLDPRIRLSK
jgi:peptide/nickel transport system permease protein